MKRGGTWWSLILRELWIAFLLSFAVHAFVLMLPVYPLSGALFAGHSSRGGRLQVSLSSSAPARTPLRPELAHSATFFGEGIREKHGVPVVPVYVEAHLLSEITLDVDDPTAFGFMVLSVEIDADGVVQATGILHTDFSQELTASILQKFSAAKFRPAERGGESQGATLLFRVDVD